MASINSAVINQKGGIGKTTGSMLITSNLHYLTSKTLGVYDMDWQQSFYRRRERDLALINENPEDKTHLRKLYNELLEAKPLYEVKRVCAHRRNDEYRGREKENPYRDHDIFSEEYERDKNKYDYLFFDLAGNITNEEFACALPHIDYMFVPCYIDDETIDSTCVFLNTVKNIVGKRKLRLKGVYPYFNRFSFNKSKDVWQLVRDYIEEETGYQFLEMQLMDKTELVNEIKSTVYPVPKFYDDENYALKFIKCIADKIGLNFEEDTTIEG